MEHLMVGAALDAQDLWEVGDDERPYLVHENPTIL
jgi:hypothetical protein